MAIYKSGSVTVYVGSTTVRGNGTVFNTYVSAGDLFKLTSESAFYDVAAVNSATNLSLTGAYANSNYGAGATLAAMPYQIVTDFTTNYNLPEISVSDTNFQYIYTKTVRKIDSSIYNASVFYIKCASEMEVTGTPYGVVLHSPSGSRFRLTVSNTGSIYSTAL